LRCRREISQQFPPAAGAQQVFGTGQCLIAIIPPLPVTAFTPAQPTLPQLVIPIRSCKINRSCRGTSEMCLWRFPEKREVTGQQ
jgi:hypothetical protein